MKSPTLIPLRSPSEGLEARLAMIAGATDTLDLQYYLWESDAVGLLMLTRLIDAADRGVSVRLLVDDLRLRTRTHAMASLSQHPNIEIKSFNPWFARSSRLRAAAESMRRFRQLNRRMHNKMMIADSSSAIVGGRNIANEHFGLNESFNLVDYDLLLSGVAIERLREVFEAYWTSGPAVAATTLEGDASASDLDTTEKSIRSKARECVGRIPGDLPRTTSLSDTTVAGSIPVSEADIELAFDTPETSTGGPGTQVLDSLRRAVAVARTEIVVLTPFFVPREVAVDLYQSISETGVKIRTLTNSLASNSGTISNSGLDVVRRRVIEAGVELRELRPDAADKAMWELPDRPSAYLGLHAKVYVIDRERVILGSVNLDPRSKYLNTEIGLTIDSPQLAAETVEAIEQLMTPQNSWHVTIDEHDQLTWTSDEGSTHTQPARNTLQRLADQLLSKLPIKKYV